MVRSNRRKVRRGFSLIEAALATVILGIGIVALMAAVQAGTRSNAAGRQLTQAVLLAQNIREWTIRLPFSDPDPNPAIGPEGSDPQVFVDDLDDLMAVTYSPPRDGLGQALNDMAGWAQSIQITWRDPNALQSVVPDGSSGVVHVQASVSFRGTPVFSTGWLVARRTQP